MKRRLFLAGCCGGLAVATGCLMPDGADRAWDLHVQNLSANSMELRLRLVTESDSEFFARTLSLDYEEEWVLTEDFDVQGSVEILIDIEGGVEWSHLWEDPDGANPPAIDIDSRNELEFVQGVA